MLGNIIEQQKSIYGYAGLNGIVRQIHFENTILKGGLEWMLRNGLIT